MPKLKLDLTNLGIRIGQYVSKPNAYDGFTLIDSKKTSLKYAGNMGRHSIADSYSHDGTFTLVFNVVFDDGSRLAIKSEERGNDFLIFKAESGTGEFDIAALTGQEWNAAKTAIENQVKAAVQSVASMKDVEEAKAVLEKKVAQYNEDSLQSFLFYKAIQAFKGSTVSVAVSDAVNAVSVGNNIVAAELKDLGKLDFSNAGAVSYDTKKLPNLAEFIGSSYGDKVAISSLAENLAIKTGGGNDTVDISGIDSGKTASIDLGDGDDTLNIAKTAKTGTADITLGTGRDIVNIESSAATANIADYNYKDGDRINLTYNGADKAISAAELNVVDTENASLKIGNVTATVQASADVAAVNVAGKKDVVTFFTATDDAKSVNINAKDISNTVHINAKNSSQANITLGSGTSHVTLNQAGEPNSINLNGAKEAKITGLKWNDNLILDGAKLSNITVKYDKATGTRKLIYGATTIDLGDQMDFYLNGQRMHISKGEFFPYIMNKFLKDADSMGIYGNEKNSMLFTEDKNVHLADTDRFRDVYNVSAYTKNGKKIDVSGFTTKGTRGVYLQVAGGPVNVWAYNKNANAKDRIELGSITKYQDTLSFVSDDGRVEVADFDFGGSETSDILYLRDTKDINALNISTGKLQLGSSQLTFENANQDLLQLKLADGTSSLVAANLGSTEGAINIKPSNDRPVDFYILNGNNTTLNVAKDAAMADAVRYKYSNFDANHTAGTMISTANVSGFAHQDDEVIIGAVANTTVAGSSKSHIWVCGATESGNIDITASTGSDQIDFISGIDKKVYVTGFDASKDVIYLRGSENLKSVVEGYKFEENKKGGIQITGADNADSQLVLMNASSGNLTLKTKNGSILKAAVNSAEEAAFSTDVQIYAGMKKLVADMSTTGEVAVRVGTKGEFALDSSNTYYAGNTVTEFDGSKSNAVFHLTGSSTEATTLKGGNTANSFYGGGSFNDTMVGSSSAVDTFYFGKGDGKDIIQDADGKDTVYLMNATLEEISIDKDKKVISIGTSDTLTFGSGAEDALKAGELTFNIGGSNYVCKDGKFVAKEA